MDEEVFRDGSRRLKVSVSGFNESAHTVAADAFRLNLYAFETEPTVRSLFTAQLGLDQAVRLYQFLAAISIVTDQSQSTSGRFVELRPDFAATVIEALAERADLRGNPDLVRAILRLNPTMFRTLVETELTAFDLQCLAYRRDQLTVMNELLTSEPAFAAHQARLGVAGKEAVWQAFFEANQWIFGYALNYVIGEGIQPERLEQVVAGHSLASAGKRVDALLHTRGIIRSLCYVEIKTHDTPLLHTTEYRPEVWRPSTELSGAVAQSQKTVQLAAEHLQTTLRIPLGASRGGEAFFNYAPRAIVVCGDLGEFLTEHGADTPKFSSFELYRRGFRSPEIITFDELHDRARAIVEFGLAARAAS